jgi:hypothetical protein
VKESSRLLNSSGASPQPREGKNRAHSVGSQAEVSDAPSGLWKQVQQESGASRFLFETCHDPGLGHSVSRLTRRRGRTCGGRRSSVTATVPGQHQRADSKRPRDVLREVAHGSQ